MKRTLLLLGGLAPLLAGCAGVFPFLGGGAPEPLPMDAGVQIGTLENGVTYYIRANQEPPERAELRLVVNAGSVLEDADQLGLAHVVEHMAFNGTRNFERQEIVDYLESIGMRFGPDVNAYTSFDETVYMLTLPTDSAGVLEKGFQILEDWAWGITFDSLMVEKERGVVTEEWRLGQGAGTRLRDRQFPILTRRSRYAERLPIGTRESLATFDHEALRRFYEDWYRPDLMAVVAVGDFDADRVEALIEHHFGRIPPHPDPRPRREFGVPVHRETLFSVATDPELTNTSVNLYLKRQPKPWLTRAAYQDWIAESLATSMLVNRLSEYTQLPMSPFLDVSSFHGRFIRPLATHVLSVRTPNGGAERGLEMLLLEVERAGRHGFAQTELEREKREMLRSMQQRYAERDQTTSSSFAADYSAHFLYGGVPLDLDTEYELYRELIPQISLGAVNRKARDWSRASDRVILVSAPEREGLARPSHARIQRVIESSARRGVRPYEDAFSDLPLVASAPVPGEIVAEREIEEIGVHEWQLGNGARVILKPTRFREDQVLFAARSPGGTSLVDDEDYFAALTATAVVQSGGLGELSPTDLRKRLAGTIAGVGADIGETHQGLSGAASPLDLDILFQLIYLRFTAPRMDTTAFLAYQAQARASLANRSASPEAAFQDTLRVTLAQHHPRARPTSSEMFSELDLHRSFEIYRDRFADAGDFTFYFVGNFEPDSLRPFVEEYVASLPSLGRTQSWIDRGVRPPTGVVHRTVRRGLEQKAAVQLVFTGGFDFNRENIYALQTLADVLRLRLRENLREELGGTYGVDVRAAANHEPLPQYQFSVGFGSDPHRVDELVAAVFAEIERLHAEGVPESDLEKVREMQFRSREVDLRQNHFWLTQLLNYDRFGWELSQIPATPLRTTTITPQLVQEAAAAFLDPRNYVRVTLLPEVYGGS
jgi:zinc protease